MRGVLVYRHGPGVWSGRTRSRLAVHQRALLRAAIAGDGRGAPAAAVDGARAWQVTNHRLRRRVAVFPLRRDAALRAAPTAASSIRRDGRFGAAPTDRAVAPDANNGVE